MTDEVLDRSWIDRFAAAAGVEPFADGVADELLALASTAAHGSGDRRNAPLACFLAGLRLGRDGVEPDVAAVAGMREAAPR